MHELITLKTLPVIVQQLEAKSKEIKKKTAEYLSMVCTNETVKAVKAARAELNNEKKELESQRIAMKNQYMAEYEDFLKTYKMLITDIYDDAEIQLKTKIEQVEDKIKEELESEVRAHFDEYLANFPKIDFITFEKAGLKILKTSNVEKLKNECEDFINRVSDDLEMISTQPNEAEILVEYIPTLNASQAITSIAAKHQAIEKQKKQLEESKNAHEPVPEIIKEEPESEFAPGYDERQIAFVKYEGEHKEFSSKEYAYIVPESEIYRVGEFVDLETRNGHAKGLIVRFGTMAEVPAKVFPYLKYLPKKEKEIPLPSFAIGNMTTVTFIVTDTPERIAALEEMIKALDYDYRMEEE
jgi:LmbE family N-acetylglucosaminyl deacetylase